MSSNPLVCTDSAPHMGFASKFKIAAHLLRRKLFVYAGLYFLLISIFFAFNFVCTFIGIWAEYGVNIIFDVLISSLFMVGLFSLILADLRGNPYTIFNIAKGLFRRIPKIVASTIVYTVSVKIMITGIVMVLNLFFGEVSIFVLLLERSIVLS